MMDVVIHRGLFPASAATCFSLAGRLSGQLGGESGAILEDVRQKGQRHERGLVRLYRDFAR